MEAPGRESVGRITTLPPIAGAPEEFENGREYYRYHGNKLAVLPEAEWDRPSREYLDWHSAKVFVR